MLKKYVKKVARKFANLQLALSLLILIGIIISIGTVIEQNQSLTFYKDNYPENKPMFGFLTWKIITLLDFDNLYGAWWFLLILVLFASSLISCTFTTQLPTIKTLKIWKFLNRPRQLQNLITNETLDVGLSNTFAYNCNDNKYHFFRQQKKGYAYSGLLGRVAPVFVHASIVILLLGVSLGSLNGYTSQELIPRGEIVHVQNLIKFGSITNIPQDLSFRINDFWVTYTKDKKIDQFYSDLSILDGEGKELKRKTIFVNEPFLFKNLVVYQTDWELLGVKIRLPDGRIFQVPFKEIRKGGKKFWLGSFKVDRENTKTYSIVKSDLSENFSIYDENGILLNETLIGKFFSVKDDFKIQVVEFITSTGLQIKVDPGIFTVYLSFPLLMVSIYVSFFTYSQIWLLETPERVTTGGKSNRAVFFFQEEFRKIIKRTIKTTV
jgi:cytochrome c biogenesis protein